MTVDQPNKIDIIALSKDGKRLALVIADHFPWDNPEETPQHLKMLQDKINLYCAYIESDQFLKSYPQASEIQIAIEVAFADEPDDAAKEFMELVKAEIKKDGIDFVYSVSAA
jgi:hypothetical protein